MKIGPQWKEKCWSDAHRQACSDTLPCMQKAGLLPLRASHTGCEGGGAGPAPMHAKNPGMCLQLAPARAIRSSKALCWSLLCNNKTSLMSLSSKPISLNWLISWRSSVIWKTVCYLQEKSRWLSAWWRFSTEPVRAAEHAMIVDSSSPSTAHSSNFGIKSAHTRATRAPGTAAHRDLQSPVCHPSLPKPSSTRAPKLSLPQCVSVSLRS